MNKSQIINKVGLLLLLLLVLGAFYFINLRVFNKTQKPQPINEKQVGTKTNQNTTIPQIIIDRIKQEGYTVIDSSTYEPSSPLNVLIGVCTGSVDGYCQKAFFFYKNRYLGTDVVNPSASLQVRWRDDKTIALEYELYHPNDPMCCPTAGSKIVRFQWDGDKLTALDPIPTTEGDSDLSRR